MAAAGNAETSVGVQSVENCPATKDMTILTYNIAWGGDGGKNLGSISQWVRAFGNGYDVIALNEMNQMDQEGRLQSFAESCGFMFSVLLKARTGYHLGIMSHRPILVHQTKSHPYHHGLLDVETFGFRFLVTHLSPVSSDKRLAECKDLGQRISELTSEGVPAVLLGDLNTLSPLDREQHIALDLLTSLAANQRLKTKFLMRGPAGMEIDYRPMQTLLDAGFVDLTTVEPSNRDATQEDGASVLGKMCGPDSTGPTVPTHNHLDPMHAAAMRLDYILGNAKAKTVAVCRAVTVRDNFTDANSDHYPVRAQLELSGVVGQACMPQDAAYVSNHIVLEPAA